MDKMSFNDMDKNLKAIKKAGAKQVGPQPYRNNGEKRSRPEVEAEYKRHWRWVERSKKKYGC